MKPEIILRGEPKRILFAILPGKENDVRSVRYEAKLTYMSVHGCLKSFKDCGLVDWVEGKGWRNGKVSLTPKGEQVRDIILNIDKLLKG
jgi:hypothetical protein